MVFWKKKNQAPPKLPKYEAPNLNQGSRIDMGPKPKPKAPKKIKPKKTSTDTLAPSASTAAVPPPTSPEIEAEEPATSNPDALPTEQPNRQNTQSTVSNTDSRSFQKKRGWRKKKGPKDPDDESSNDLNKSKGNDPDNDGNGNDKDTRDLEREQELALADFDPVNDSKKMWIELARKNIGVFAKTAYEYDIYHTKRREKKGFLVVQPSVGEEKDEHVRSKEKPKYFDVKSVDPVKDLFSIRYKLGPFFNRAVQIDISINKELIASVQQKGRNLIIMEQGGMEVMRCTGVPAMGCCSPSATAHFKCDVFVTDGPNLILVGQLGRNGTIMDQTIVGEPGGFYFFIKKGTTPQQLQNIHKLYILAILIVYMTIYAD